MPLSPAALFVRAGLTRDDGLAYAVLAKHDGISIADICRKIGLHRPAAYRALARLEKAGLLRKTKRGKRFIYSAADPDRLERLLARADAENARSAEMFNTVPSGNGVVTVLRGSKGLATVLDDLARTLGKDEIFYRISSRKPSTSVEGFVPKDFLRTRDGKKLQQFVLCNAALRAAPHKKRIDGLSKVVPEGGAPFEYDIALVIYGDKVATVDYAAKQAVVVKNARLAKFHIRLFKMLFDRI